MEAGQIRSVTIQGRDIRGEFSDRSDLGAGTRFRTITPEDPGLMPLLRKYKVRILVKPEDESPWVSMIISWLPMLLLIGVWIFFMRQMQMGGGKAMSFGKSRARLQTEPGGKRITFEDVAGIDEAKEELAEIIEFLRDPKKFTRLGGRIPKGVLLVGSPGTGKNPVGPGHRGRGRSALLFHLRFGFCGDVRGRGRQPVCATCSPGQEERALHHLHRRDRRGGAPPRGPGLAADTTSASRP